MVNPVEDALRRTWRDAVYFVVFGDDFTKLVGRELFEDEAGEGKRPRERVKLGAQMLPFRRRKRAIFFKRFGEVVFSLKKGADGAGIG
jgi:hypothetical protein